MCDCNAGEGRPGSMTRRQFIKSVIAAGVVGFFLVALAQQSNTAETEKRNSTYEK